MKIRTGFVSNSSSSSYVVAIPSTFELPQDLDDRLVGWNCDFMGEKAKIKRQDLEKALKRLKIVGKVESTEKGYWPMLEILKDAGYDICSVDGGPDDYPTITNIFAPTDMYKKLMKIMMDENMFPRQQMDI